MKHYNVSYFDSLGGGSGLTRVLQQELADWLNRHPGYLIRKLQEC